MKAIHLTAYGNPVQNLQMVEVPEPNAPSAREALVRMEYAPVDYSDLLLANGVYFLIRSSLLSSEAKVQESSRQLGQESPRSKWGTGLRSHLAHSPGRKESLLRPRVFLSFLHPSMRRQPLC